MSHLNHLPHLLKETKHTIEKMEPLKSNKNPIVAALIGFCFGPLGIGIYLESWKDFFTCLGVLILVTIALIGVGFLPGWLFSAAYGFYRVHTGNR